MTGKTHTAVGFTAMIVLATFYPDSLNVADSVVIPSVGLLATVPGSLAPDVDIKGSAASKKVPLLHHFFSHRGITHTLLVPVILYALLYQFHLSVVIESQIFGFMFGWLMHIAADLLNRKGVPIFWPLLTSKYHIATVKTGTGQETVFLVVWCIVCVCVVFSKIFM